MDRRLARRNLRTALITSVIGLLMFALTFVAAAMIVFLATTIRWIRDVRRDIAELPLDHSQH